MASTQHQQQQQRSREEEYLDAQRAGFEAVQVGRATVEQVRVQGEQLDYAIRTADETQYALDKSARILRGMTWAGWFQNVVSKDVKAPDVASSTVERQVVYGDVNDLPRDARAAAQAIQNYQANLTVLDTCETGEQRQTCRLICDSMYTAANNEVAKLMLENSDPSLALHKHKFKKDLAFLRQRQQRLTEKPVSSESDRRSPPAVGITAERRDASRAGAPPLNAAQQEHLDLLSQNLDELGAMASSLNEMMGQQNHVMESIDEKSDSIQESSKMVTRRADRLVTKTKWFSSKKALRAPKVTIQSLSTGKYLSATTNGYIVLVDRPAAFEVWERTSSNASSQLLGLLHQATQKWAGQSYLTGNLACSSSSFGQREEWQTETENWKATRLLLASAGWGQGAYLKLSKDETQVQIGTSGVDGKHSAELWCIREQ